MKTISEKSQGLRQGLPTASDSLDKPGSTELSMLQQHQASSVLLSDTPGKTEHFAVLSGLNTLTPKCQVPRSDKCEPEDSGVTLHHGANSEKNFVLHSRNSSCDSGVLSASSSPAADHTLMKTYKDTMDACPCISNCKKPVEHYAEQMQTSAVSLDKDADCREKKHTEQSFLSGSQEECFQDKTYEEGSSSLLPSTCLDEKNLHDDYKNDHVGEVTLPAHPLRRYPTSDSLDEYMDACCRMSK
ncbi:uncharacterized protein LOC121918277, partial [Sceloporus undulatus]|uniref:uncharacterized protein LOC121918277 n=1 Tax=Sceloporus undulatus TaxID=8520 RepID=UPI001C4C4DD3